MDAGRLSLRRRALGPRAALLVLILAGGCVIHPSGPHGPACPTIESATYVIEYPRERLRLLKPIAARENLSPHEQTYLVNAVMAVGFSSDKADLLLMLIRNACCTAETRQQIRAKLKFTRMLGRDEQRVIQALEKADQPQAKTASQPAPG